MIIVESYDVSATPVVTCLIDLLHHMNVMVEGTRPRAGRPRVSIEEEQLEFLIEARFRVKDIALMFCCSRRTIERRLYELGMRSTNYTYLSDRELDSLVERIVMSHPQCGEKLLLVNFGLKE